jgi:hypothetical protein
MYDSFSEGGVFYGRTALLVAAAVVLTMLAHIL